MRVSFSSIFGVVIRHIDSVRMMSTLAKNSKNVPTSMQKNGESPHVGG